MASPDKIQSAITVAINDDDFPTRRLVLLLAMSSARSVKSFTTLTYAAHAARATSTMNTSGIKEIIETLKSNALEYMVARTGPSLNSHHSLARTVLNISTDHLRM